MGDAPAEKFSLAESRQTTLLARQRHVRQWHRRNLRQCLLFRRSWSISGHSAGTAKGASALSSKHIEIANLLLQVAKSAGNLGAEDGADFDVADRSASSGDAGEGQTSAPRCVSKQNISNCPQAFCLKQNLSLLALARVPQFGWPL